VEPDTEFAGFFGGGSGNLIREKSEIRLIIFVNYLVNSGLIPGTDEIQRRGRQSE